MDLQQISEVKGLMQEVLRELPADLKRRLELVEQNSRARRWANVPGVESGTGENQFSMFRALRAIRSQNFSEARYEEEVFKETAKKALGYSDDTLGGYLVPAQAVPELIEYLYPSAVAFQLGAKLLPDLMGSPVLIPKQTGPATTYWIGENISATPSNLAFGQVQLTPHKVMALIEISNALIRMALPSAEVIIQQDLGKMIGLALDIAALRGSGANNEPLGIANTPNILTYSLTAGSGAPLTSLDFAVEMEDKLAQANALRGKLGFAFNPAVRKILRKIKVPQYSGDAGVLPIVQFLGAIAEGSGYMSDKALQDALGYPFAWTTQIPKNLTAGSYTDLTEIYFGNWEDLLIGQWAGLRIMASDVAGTAFASDQTWLRVILECDVAVRHPQSFCLCNDVSVG
jgi:HK97 family phage major capsid protein